MIKKSQIDEFRDTAREIGADDNEANFDAALRKIAKGDPKAMDKMAEKLGQKDPNADFRKPPQTRIGCALRPKVKPRRLAGHFVLVV